MYQLPVNNLTKIRKARRQVKKALEDIGLEYCKEVAEEFKEFCPDEEVVKDTLGYDICTWDPSFSKTQEYRSKPFCCSECPFSSKYYSGYKNHFRNVHRKLLDGKILLNCPYCAFIASKRTMEAHIKIFHMPASKQIYGNSGGNVLGAKTNLTNAMHRVEKAMYFCKKCTFRDSLYNVVRRHIYREHFQHIVSPYVGMVSKSVKNSACSVNGNNIYCKQCQFSTRTYEALVQHVLEFHERIGSHVTNMIGHANVLISTPQPLPGTNQNAHFVSRSNASRPDPVSQPVIGYLKPAAPFVKNQSSVQTSQTHAVAPVNSNVAENNPTAVTTAQTQKWKICTVCNELFPENLYSAHFENAHKAKKVWAMAKYIMKIHNFTSKCLLCNRYLPSNTLLNHMLTHGLTCPQCHSAFHSVGKIMEHTVQAHPDEFVGPAGAAPLTFDLTIKQGKSRNVQLAVLTFNMKDSLSGQDQSAPALQNVAPLDSWHPTKMINRRAEPKSLVPLIHNSSAQRTACPLCFSILKGPISDALALHLRERHQVLQTMHPVEKKMTYKCIHCLGVYTSNMVASTITLHLVQCRAVGRNQVSQGFKSNGPGGLKRQLPPQMMSSPKRTKMNKDSVMLTCRNNPKLDGLALDPTSYAQKTYEAKKEFLTAYFNRRPYPTPEEEDKLAASLSMWRSDVAGHFASKRNICLRSCRRNNPSVLVDLDMNAKEKFKHHLVSEKERFVGTSNVISIDSDSEEEIAKPSAENVESRDQENLREETKRVDTNGPSTVSSRSNSEEEMGTPPSQNMESKDEHLTVETEHLNMNDPSTVSISSNSQEETGDLPTENVESKDEHLTEEKEHVVTNDPSTVPINSNAEEEISTPPDENVDSKDEHQTEESQHVGSNDPLTASLHSDFIETGKTPTENVESPNRENLIEESEHVDTNDASAVSISSNSGEETGDLPTDNVESKDEHLTEGSQHVDTNDPLTVSIHSDFIEAGKTPTENVESQNGENMTEESMYVDTNDPSGSKNSNSEEERGTYAENMESQERENLTEETCGHERSCEREGLLSR